MYAEWMLAPSGYYIGLLRVGNKHYYSSGRTPDHLEQNLKYSAYQNEKISASQVHLAHEKSEQIDISKASKCFMTRYVKPKPYSGLKDIKLTKTHIIAPPKPVIKQEEPSSENEEHIAEIDKNTGELVIYKLTEVKRFKLKNKEFELDKISV